MRERHLLAHVPMIPRPCQRHKTGKGFAYTPKETTNARAQVALFVGAKLKDLSLPWPMDGYYYELELGVHIPKPQDYWDDGKRCKPCFAGGDGDNHAKTVMDALQGILWTNDNRLTRIMVRKAYADQPGYVIYVTAWPIGERPKKTRKKEVK